MKTIRERLTGRVLLVLTIAIVGLGYFGWRIFDNKSVDVVAVIQFRPQQYIVPPTFPEPFDLGEFVEEQRQLVLSRTVMSNAVASTAKTLPDLLKGKADPVDALAEHFETSMISRKSMEVRLTGNEWTPEERVELLKAVIDAYLRAQRDRDVRLDLVRTLKHERDEHEEQLSRLLEALKQIEDDKSIDAELKRRELNIAFANYDKVLARLQELQTNSDAPGSIIVMDQPSIRKP